MKNKFASRIAHPDNREQNKDLRKNMGRTALAPEHKDWKKYMNESVNEAYIVIYAKKKGEKPAQAAFSLRGSALSFERDLKKDGYITMVTQKKVKGVDESVNEVKVNPTTKKFLKGMKRIKVKGLGGYMPGVDYVYVDGDKYYFVDFEGDHMELKNTNTIKQLHKLNESIKVATESFTDPLEGFPQSYKDLLNKLQRSNDRSERDMLINKMNVIRKKHNLKPLKNESVNEGKDKVFVVMYKVK